MNKINIKLIENKKDKKRGRPAGSKNKIKEDKEINNNKIITELINKLMTDNNNLLIKNNELNNELNNLNNNKLIKILKLFKLIK